MTASENSTVTAHGIFNNIVADAKYSLVIVAIRICLVGMLCGYCIFCNYHFFIQFPCLKFFFRGMEEVADKEKIERE